MCLRIQFCVYLWVWTLDFLQIGQNQCSLTAHVFVAYLVLFVH